MALLKNYLPCLHILADLNHILQWEKGLEGMKGVSVYPFCIFDHLDRIRTLWDHPSGGHLNGFTVLDLNSGNLPHWNFPGHPENSGILLRGTKGILCL